LENERDERKVIDVRSLPSSPLLPLITPHPPCNHQFIYDSHITEARHGSQRRMHTPVPAVSEYRSSHRSPTRNPSSIKLNTVLASEVDKRRTSANMRRGWAGNVFDDVRPTSRCINPRLTFLRRIPTKADYPLLSPSTPIPRIPPHILRFPPNELPMCPSQPLSSLAASSIPARVLCHGHQTAALQSNLTSPQLTPTSPFLDVFKLAQSRVSKPEIMRAGSGSDDDEGDNNSLGSGESWHGIRNGINRS